MFSFFHRSPVINIDCFTSLTNAHEFAPILAANRGKPEWIDKVSNPKFEYYRNPHTNQLEYTKPNVKTCQGFLDLFNRGFILYNWSDYFIQVDEERGYDYHVKMGQPPVHHDESQYAPGFSNSYVMKLLSPWIARTKEDVTFAVVGNDWHINHNNYRLVPGVLNFYTQCCTNVFMTFPRKNAEFLIPMGEPFYHYIPLTEKKSKLHIHLVSDAEYQKQYISSRSTVYGWKKVRALKKSLSKRTESKCPFT